MNITMRLQLAVIFFTVLLTGLAQAQAPLAGSQIGNQASATYTDQSGVARQALSNTVITNVQQVAGLTLTADNSRLASPGGTVFFPHTLTNTGNGPDTYTLTPSLGTTPTPDFTLTVLGIYVDADQDGQPDDITSPISTGINAATTIELEPNEEYFFVIGATVPGTATDTQAATLGIQAQSVFTNTLTADNTDTVNVTSGGVMTATKAIDVSQGVPGTTPITYTFTYTNTGNGPVANFTLTDVIPAGLTYVAGSGVASILNSGGTTLTDADTVAQGTTPNGITYDFGETTPNAVTVVLEQVAAGQSGTFSFQVSVDAGVAPGTIINTAQYDPDGGTGGEINTNEVPFEVLAVPGVTLADAGPLTASPGETISFTNVLQNTGNGTDTFDLTFGVDNFPAGTTFQLFLPDGNTPMVDTDDDGIPDTGPVAPLATFNVVVKATLPTNVGGATPAPTFALPLTATGNVNDTAGNPASDSATDTVNNLLSARVDITNAADGADPDTGTGNDDLGSQGTAGDTFTADPGATFTIPLAVENEGAIEDGYNLTVDSFPADWTIVIREAPSQGNAVISNSGSLDAAADSTITDPEGAGFSYIAEVTVPAGTSFDSNTATGAVDPYAITFRAESPTSGVFDTILNNVTVNPVRELSLTTNNAGQVFPGGSVVYTHLLKNLGNVDEGVAGTSDIALTTANSLSAQGFTSVIYIDLNDDGVLDSADPAVTTLPYTGATAPLDELNPGEEFRLFVKVFAPLGAPDSAIDVATLTATPSGTVQTVAAPAALVNEDTTTVVLGDLEILKEQALDILPVPTIDGEPDGGDTSYSVLPLSALPGQSIIYRVTVTNSGSTDATNILVYDTTPVNTTYTPINNTDSEATITGGTVNTVDTEPAVNTGGTFTFNVGTLQPGQSAVITFGVTIDQ